MQAFILLSISYFAVKSFIILMASPLTIPQALDLLQQRMLHSQTSDYPTLRHGIVRLENQITFQSAIEEPVSLLRSHSPLTPTQRNRLKLLIQHLWGSKASSDHRDRQMLLEELATGKVEDSTINAEIRADIGCQAFVLIAAVFKPGTLFTLKREYFDYLINYSMSHVIALSLPPGWVYHSKLPSLVDDEELREITSPAYHVFVEGK